MDKLFGQSRHEAECDQVINPESDMSSEIPIFGSNSVTFLSPLTIVQTDLFLTPAKYSDRWMGMSNAVFYFVILSLYSCTTDYIEVFAISTKPPPSPTYSNETVIGKYCGSRLPGPLVSEVRDNYLLCVFSCFVLWTKPVATKWTFPWRHQQRTLCLQSHLICQENCFPELFCIMGLLITKAPGSFFQAASGE